MWGGESVLGRGHVLGDGGLVALPGAAVVPVGNRLTSPCITAATRQS